MAAAVEAATAEDEAASRPVAAAVDSAVTVEVVAALEAALAVAVEHPVADEEPPEAVRAAVVVVPVVEPRLLSSRIATPVSSWPAVKKTFSLLRI